MSESNPGSRRGSLFSSLFNIPANSNPVQASPDSTSNQNVNVPHTLFQDIGSIQMNINANLGSNSDSSSTNFQQRNIPSGSSAGSLNRKGSFLTTALDISQELLLLQQQQQNLQQLQANANPPMANLPQENSSRTLQQQISLDEIYKSHQQQQNQSQSRNMNPTINLNLDDGINNIPVIHSLQQNKLNISININQAGGNSKNNYGNLFNQNLNINQNTDQNNFQMNGSQTQQSFQQHQNFQGYGVGQQGRYQTDNLQERIAGVINQTPQYLQNFENSNFMKSENQKSNEPTMPTIGINIQNIPTQPRKQQLQPPQVKYENPIDRHLSQQYPAEQPVYRAERHASNSQISAAALYNIDNQNAHVRQNLPIPRQEESRFAERKITNDVIVPKAIYRNSDGKKVTMVQKVSKSQVTKKKNKRRESGVPAEFLENLSRELEKVQQLKQNDHQQVTNQQVKHQQIQPKIESIDLSQENLHRAPPKSNTPPGVISSVFDSERFGNEIKKASSNLKSEPKKPLRNPNPVPIPPNYEEVPANRRKPGPASRDTITKSVIDPITKKIKFLCDYCGKTFGKRWDVERHRRYIHTGERPYSCDVCGKAFAEPGALAKHKRRHLGQCQCRANERKLTDPVDGQAQTCLTCKKVAAASTATAAMRRQKQIEEGTIVIKEKVKKKVQGVKIKRAAPKITVPVIEKKKSIQEHLSELNNSLMDPVLKSDSGNIPPSGVTIEREQYADLPTLVSDSNLTKLNLKIVEEKK